jgi:Kef-type K+ transport system membrane component KefB
MDADRNDRSRWPVYAAYGAALCLGIGGYLLVRGIGESMRAPAAATLPQLGSEQGASVSMAGLPAEQVLQHVLVTLAAVIGLGSVLSRLLSVVGQPPVIAEVLAGIVLGPSVLGAIAPNLMHALIPGPDLDPRGEVAAVIQVIAQLGILVYMFVIGLDLNLGQMQRHVGAAVAISHCGILIPFLAGSLLALGLYHLYAPAGVDFTSFSLFVGVAMAITAFPVLARILSDRGLETSTVGALALISAAADDVTAWCLLALVVGIVRAQASSAAWVAAWAITFVAVMLLVVRPAFSRYCARADGRSAAASPVALGLGLSAALVAGFTTEWIGIHAVFGAFLLGAVIPHDSSLASALRSRLRDAVTILLLPAFFAFTGMRTQIGLLSSWYDWLTCLAIILVATLGKFGGTLLAARWNGLTWRDSAALGTLMNTRGLMELIVLNIGLDLGVIESRLFAMMVIMALATTIATSPLIGWLLPETRGR